MTIEVNHNAIAMCTLFLNGVLPEHWSHNNPIDIIGDAKPERYQAALEVIEKKKFFDFLFLILTPQTMAEPDVVAKMLVKFHKKTGIPCFGSFIGGQMIESARKILKEENILNFHEPEYGAEVISKMVLK